MLHARQTKALSLIIVLVMLFGMAVRSRAQSARNYIYLFDCTQSMQWGEEPIWEPARDALRETVGRQAKEPNTLFHIVAFQDKKVIPEADILAFDGEQYNAKKQGEIDSLFNRVINGPKSKTNIVSALKKGFSLCNPAMENRVCLFTDGKHNCPDAGTPEQCINAWCGNHPKSSRLFYVMMTDAAVDGKVMECIDACDDAFAVQCHNGFIPQIADIGSHIMASTYELDRDYGISFSESVPLPVKIACDDPVFDVQLVGKGASDRRILLRFIPKGGLSPEELSRKLSQLQSGEDYYFTLKVTSDDKDYFIANPEVSVTMKNLPPRKLQIFEGKTEALNCKEVRWYDRFLWSKAAKEDTVVIDFAPVFDSRDERSAMTFVFRETKENPVDYELMFNGRPVGPDGKFIIRPHDSEAKLTLHFNHDAKEGKRLFTLMPEPEHLDIINGLSAAEFPSLAVNMSYDRCRNWLKTVCFWLLIVIIAALVLWFIMFKPNMYPKVDVTSLQITGDGVYIRKKIKGCRRVVLTNRKQSQSMLSRCFTGKIMYIDNAAFTPEIRMEKSTKKSVRFYVSKPWGIVPTPVVKQYGNAMLMNTGNNTQYKVTIS